MEEKTPELLFKDFIVAVNDIKSFQDTKTKQVHLNGRVLSSKEKNVIIDEAKGLLMNQTLKEVLTTVQNEAAREIYFSSNVNDNFFFNKGQIQAVQLIVKKIISFAEMEKDK